MTDITNTQDTFNYFGPLQARMACHLGDHKPSALCNIMGDQPLFYIDYVDTEEADFIDPMGFLNEADASGEFYPENIENLRRRISRLESASQHIDGYIRENVEEAFDAASQNRNVTSYTSEQLLNALSQSRMAALMLETVQARGLKLVMNSQIDTALYDRDGKTIHVNPRLSLDFAAFSATRALRQAWSHMNGAAIHPLCFAPEEAVLLNRIQEADLVCTQVRVAWEMNLAGQKDAWARIITGSGYDLAVGFAREAISDFRSLNNGAAANASFERWFFSGRCKDVDRKLIQTMLADDHGMIFENPSVSKMITADVIARTGDTPLGKNYLTGMVETILSDPLFTEVRDRSNANFLWFIKFERSFRASEDNVLPELEQSLQGVPHVPAGTFSGTPATQGCDHAQQAEIITFKSSGAPAQVAHAKKNGTNNMATVYYIDHFLTFSNR